MNEKRCQAPAGEKGNFNGNLDGYALNVTSQHGEDGIIRKALEIIGENDRWCVEFGSWDGVKCSNTFSLITENGYSSVLIEGDAERFRDLEKTFGSNDKVIRVNAFVGFEDHNCLDSILGRTAIPENFDLLSIDIDGNDYHVWKRVRRYRPKVVVIEYNPTIPDCVEFVQPEDMTLSQGSSLLSLDKLARSKGYELVAVTRNNAVFVDSKYFAAFGIDDNSIGKLRSDRSLISYIFCGYDGTVFLSGCGKLPWQDIPYSLSGLQQLPAWARKRMGDRNFIRKQLGRFLRRRLKKRS